MKTKWILCLSLCFSLGFLSGCKKKEPQPADLKPQQSQQAETGTKDMPEKNTALAPAASDKAILVTVNGQPVYQEEFDKQLAAQAAFTEKTIPAKFLEQYRKAIREKVQDQMVLDILIDQKAKEKGLTVNKEEIEQRIDQKLAAQNMTRKDWQELLQAKGQSQADYERETEKELLVEKIIDTETQGTIQITPEQIKAYYDANPDTYQIPAGLRIRHVLIKTNPQDSEEQKTAAKNKAQIVLDNLTNGGSFPQLAKDNSDDSVSASRGGDLGWLALGKEASPVAAAVSELTVGQISDVVILEDGCHVIQVTDKKEPRTISFEEAQKDIEKTLIHEQKMAFAKEYFQELKDQARIVTVQ